MYVVMEGWAGLREFTGSYPPKSVLVVLLVVLVVISLVNPYKIFYLLLLPGRTS